MSFTGLKQIDEALPFEICSLVLCHYSPLIGCFVPIIYVPEDLAESHGFGSASLMLIQSIYIDLYGVERMSVWFSKETRYATVLQFYRKLGFYPVQAQFFPLPYILRDKLCEKIHEVNGTEFLLSYHKRISKRSKKSKPTQLIGTNFREDITLTCESCGVSCDGNEEGQHTFIFCTHKVPKQSI